MRISEVGGLSLSAWNDAPDRTFAEVQQFVRDFEKWQDAQKGRAKP